MDTIVISPITPVHQPSYVRQLSYLGDLTLHHEWMCLDVASGKLDELLQSLVIP